MAKSKIKREPKQSEVSLKDAFPVLSIKEEQLAERQLLMFDLTKQADDLAEATKKRIEREKLKIELIGGGYTSIYEEKQKIQKILSDFPVNYEPKFSEFFSALGKLLGWTEEESANYHKPPMAAKTINEVIYARFTPDVIQHIHQKNPYIRYCIRRYKHYRFLADEGILKLEEFIYDAATVMRASSSYYEFRMKHAEKFGTVFQQVLFR